ncbi:MAG: hypothetical protein EYC70_04935 [Planctomycetota bacterium]|nr:MAG: hypothetical protein EYC70_04935 [Planctomycetota bacterium]
MEPALRHQLSALDRALLALLNERARLLAGVAGDDPGRAPAVDDLLRRHAGPFEPAAIRAVFAAVDRGCRKP